MNNSATNSPKSRATKPFCQSGQPNGRQWTSTGAGEKVPQSAYGGSIAQAALNGIGMSTKDIPGTGTGKLGCAVAVSLLFTKATNQGIMLGTVPTHVLSTSILCNSLLYDKRFKRVPMTEAAPGDIIIACGGHQAEGYAGIVVDHGRIVTNSRHGVKGDCTRTAGTIQNDSSLVEVQRYPQEMALFRYIGVQKHPSYPLANQGYNPNEPRLPAGQSGGGQWTTAGAEDRLRQRSDIARWIVDQEARRDKDGNLKVYILPKNDGGGSYEVAGINEKYDPEMAKRLKHLVETGCASQAENEAAEYIAKQTDEVANWTENPVVEAYLRDCRFNRGPGGVRRILQKALGVEVDGKIGP